MNEVIAVNAVIAENVRRHREQKSWSQETLAGAADISVRTVQRVEKGDGAGKEALLAIAGALEVSVDDLRTDSRQVLALLLGVAPHEVTPEFLAKKAEEAKEKYHHVSLAIANAADELEAVLDVDSMRFDCISCPEKVRDVAAELEEFLADWMNVAAECGPVERRGYAKAAFGIVQQIQELGSVVSIGVDKHRLGFANGDSVPWRTLFVVVAPSDEAKTVAMIERNMKVNFRV
ncbi:helix-turn-helix transcriptional regulator [Myxococcus sp. AM001]|nr:helix-turn-helix transcriptional regulator [Myxococcus sp. AM001]